MLLMKTLKEGHQKSSFFAQLSNQLSSKLYTLFEYLHV